MGRLAELFEKKALNTLSDEEKKEMDTLLAEAKMADQNEDQHTDDEDVEKEVEAAAQKMADMVQEKIEKNNKEILDVLQEMRGSNENIKITDNSNGYVVDKQLGKKSVSELSEIKVKVPGRDGKKFSEVSERTTLFFKAFFSQDIQKLQILSEGVAADGGYLVPEEFANMIIEDRRDANIMRQLAAPPINITTDTFHLPNLASRPKAYWRAEKAVKNTSTASFGESVFHPYSLASIVPLANEFVADASLGVGGSVVNYLSGLLGVSLAEEEEKAFWVGGGTTRPSGVDGGVYTLRTVASPAVTDVARADTIIQAKQRTPQGYRQRAVWVANSVTWEEIARLKDSQNRYLLSDLAGSETQLLRGRPVYESNYLAGGTLLYADLDYYQIVDREGISIRVSDEAVVAGISAFERNLTFIRAEERVDGQLVLPAAVTKVTGLGTP
jgi:HK97 family phage major capsid protein